MKRTLIFASLAAALLASGSTLAADAIVKGDVNLRAGPDPEFPTISSLDAGTPVSVQGCVRNWTWCDVAYRGDRGWVPGEFLENDYQGRRVLIREAGVAIGIPFVTFNFITYWDTHYHSRPFYVERTRYVNVVNRLDVNIRATTTTITKAEVEASARTTGAKAGTSTSATSTSTSVSGTATTTEAAKSGTTSTSVTTQADKANPAASSSGAGVTATESEKAKTRANDADGKGRAESARRATAEAGGTRAVEQDSSPQRAVKSDTTKPEPGQASAKREDDSSAIEPDGERGRPAQARADQPDRGKAAEPKTQPEQKGERDKARKDKDEEPEDDKE